MAGVRFRDAPCVDVIEETQYLKFDFRKSKSKLTAVVLVKAKRSAMLLGEIKWYAPWKQYAFFPRDRTLFNSECMTDILTVIAVLMKQRKKTKTQ